MMTSYATKTNEGKALNARFELQDSTIILYSRGGTKGKDAINPDYSETLRVLLHRLADSEMVVGGAWVDSSRVQNLPLEARKILGEEDREAPPEEQFKRMTSRMQRVGRSKDAALSPGGNSTKRIRIELKGSIPISQIVDALKATASNIDLGSQQRLPVEDLNKVTPEHIWNAIQLLLSGQVSHDFGESTDFDLITDEGTRLAPKAVFGAAATEALGFKVLPKHFTGGEGSPCFRILRAAGYSIHPKSSELEPKPLLELPWDAEWTEGKTRLVTHFRKERGTGLAKAKKAEFRRLHGKLICERCGKDPVAEYQSEHGEACIEVHHNTVQVQDMDEGHITKLEDLQCLCANCHKFVHRLLRTQLA